jgi:hypothetical protein
MEGLAVVPPPIPGTRPKSLLGPRNAPGTAGLIMGLLRVVRGDGALDNIVVFASPVRSND